MSNPKPKVTEIDLIHAANALFAHSDITTCESEAMRLCALAKNYYQGVAKWDKIECGKSTADFCEVNVDVIVRDEIFNILDLPNN